MEKKNTLESLKGLFSDSKKHLLKGYILYIFDIDKYEARLMEIYDKIKPNLEMSSTNEIFKLDSVCFYLNGLPVYVLIKGCPFSVEWKTLSEENKQKFILKGYSASEIKAKISSIYVNRIFSKGALQAKDILLMILSMGISALITYIITYMTMNAEILRLTQQLTIGVVP